MSYREPLATRTQPGIVTVGTGIEVIDGVISANATATLTAGYFFSNVTQTNPVAGAVNTVTYNNTTLTNGITLVNGNSFVVSKTTNYTLTYTIQFVKTAGGAAATINLWARLNGNNIAQSNTITSISNNNATSVLAANYTLAMKSGDNLQLVWVSDSANAELLNVPAVVGPPAVPEAPSVRITVVEV